MDRYTYGDKENDVEPDEGDDNIGNDELVFEFPPQDNDECVDCDGLNSHVVHSALHMH
jgi:hypothetical protein